MDRITCGRHLDCLRLTNGTIQVTVATRIGPRVLHYGFTGGANLLGDCPDLATTTSLGAWKPWGGHRVWAAPEQMPGSYAPDDSPVDAQIDPEERSVVLRQRTDAAGIEKRLIVSLAKTGTAVTVVNEITNRTFWPIHAASWAVTIMAPGSRAILPQAPFQSHDERLQPVRPLVFWSFTDLADPRWAVGARLIQLTATPEIAPPQKIGIANGRGWCAATTENLTFVKRFDHDPQATYPDFGCNNEIYAAGSYLEVETLGPLRLLQPGDTTSHVERWYVFNATIPTDDAAADDALERLVATTA